MVNPRYQIAPTKNHTHEGKPWEGSLHPKQWAYSITAAIPHIDTPYTLGLVIELLRRQTMRPTIQILDTGSTPANLETLSRYQDHDVEIHYLRFNGRQHPSDFPAIAMDVAFASCQTQFIFTTHTDVFLRRRDFLEDLLKSCDQSCPAVGYEITERPHPDWHGMISHTASIFSMDTVYRLGLSWNLRRLCNKYGIHDPSPDPRRPNWPDTELLVNYQLRDAGITPLIIGTEKNGERTIDRNIDHCRSHASTQLYDPAAFRRVRRWIADATEAAEARIKTWGEPTSLRAP